MTTSAHHDEDSHEVPAHVHHSKKLLKACKTAQLIQNLSAPKTASIQKFALLLLRNSASIARQISYMVHGTSVHGTSTWSISKTFPPPKPRRFRNSPWLMLRNSASAARQISYMVHGTWSMVHLPGPSQNLSAPKTASLQKFALLLLRNSASTARQISYMVHGTWSMVHERVYILASGENRSFPKRGCASISFLQPGAQPP